MMRAGPRFAAMTSIPPLRGHVRWPVPSRAGTASGPALLARLLVAALMFASALHAVGARAEDKSAIRGVLELFTSQGCSSCPPADKLLADYAKQPGVLTLGYHVDYWDYIGWRDTHGSRANTERQRDYAKALNAGTIYTPQMVVNGQTHVIGSFKNRIDSALASTGLDPRARVDLRLQGDRLHITADLGGAAAETRAPMLVLVTFDQSSRTDVTRGENRGRQLVDTHPVRDWRVIGMWSGKPLDVDLPKAMLDPTEDGPVGCAAILQTVTSDGAPGRILAAATIVLDNGS